MYHVLLYYKFVRIQHPAVEVKMHKEVCKALGLTGRILINEQGINGTVGGDKTAIALYRAYMDQHRIFAQIDWKESASEIAPFPNLKVRYREEIITTDVKDQIDLCRRGNHVDRDTFHQWLQNKEDMVILDMRNDYEWEIGRFVNSVRPPMKYFRDLKDNMEFYEQFKGNTSAGLRPRKIVMFCTGGIRCEPASAYFIAKGFDPAQIYQLEGGIVKYAEKYGNEGFYEGKCYVFDERIALPVNVTESAVVVGHCALCNTLCDVYRNCRNKWCNKHFIGCDACTQRFAYTCSEACQEMIRTTDNVRPARPAEMTHRNK